MKKAVSIILCILIVLGSVCTASAVSYDNWSDAYRNFIVNQEYLTFGQDYAGTTAPGYPQSFALHDMDADGVPELIVYDGLWYPACFYGYNVYQYKNKAIRFAGSFSTYDISYIIGSEFNGLFCEYAHTGFYSINYVSITSNGSIKQEMVAEGTDIPEDGQTYDGVRITGKTNNKKLYNAFCKAANVDSNRPFDYSSEDNLERLSLYTLSEISDMGWGQFLLLTGNSLNYYNDVAIMCSYLCEAANSKTEDNIKAKYEGYGFKHVEPGNYPGSSAYTFGYKTLANETLLCITTRGTTTNAERIGDWLKGGLEPFLTEEIYDNIYDYEEIVWNALKSYVDKYSEITRSDRLVILVTGHSLGGAAANTVAARINYNIRNGSEPWLKRAKKEFVYAYTFGAIKVFSEEGGDVTPNLNTGYENIHNIYNYYDSFGPYGSDANLEVASIYDKYGHTELFYKDYHDNPFGNLYANHDIANYRDALQNHLVTCEGKDTEINPDSNGSNVFVFIAKYVGAAVKTISDVGYTIVSTIATAINNTLLAIGNWLFGG